MLPRGRRWEEREQTLRYMSASRHGLEGMFDAPFRVRPNRQAITGGWLLTTTSPTPHVRACRPPRETQTCCCHSTYQDECPSGG